MITILCWLWSQPGGQYNAEMVNRWAAMVRRHTTVPHRLMCVTDQPEGIDDDIAIAPLPEWPAVGGSHWSVTKGRPQCYHRLDMFRPDAADTYGERFLMMDLDLVIFDSLDPLLTRPEDFVVMQTSQPKRYYNGSLVLLTAGSMPHVYQEWTPERQIEASSKHLGSDQAWYAHILGPGMPTFSKGDGVHYYRRHKPVDKKCRVLLFCGSIKPWHVHRHGNERVMAEYYPERQYGWS